MSGFTLKRSCFAEGTGGTFTVLVERVEEVEVEAVEWEGWLGVSGAVGESGLQSVAFLILRLSIKRKLVN